MNNCLFGLPSRKEKDRGPWGAQSKKKTRESDKQSEGNLTLANKGLAADQTSPKLANAFHTTAVSSANKEQPLLGHTM